MPGDSPGYLYVMSNPNDDSGAYKIGYSKHPDARSRELMGSGHMESGRFDILLCYPVVQARKAERIAFSLLSDFRYNEKKEFFICDLNRIMDVLNAVVRHVNLGRPLETTFISTDEIDALQSRDYL